MKQTKHFAPALAILLAVILTAGAGCGGQSQNASNNAPAPAPETVAEEAPVDVPDEVPDVETMPMRYYMPGSPSLETDAVNEEINKKLEKDGVPIFYETIYIPWDQWVNRTNVMLSSGEEFELIHVMGDYIPLSNYASRNALAPLDELLDKHTPDLWKQFDDVFWECATVGGKVMGVPAQWRDNSGQIEGQLTIRIDKFNEFDIAVPTTLAELADALSELQDKWSAQDGMKRYVWEHSLDRTPLAFHRTYDTWPYFTGDGGIFMVRQNGEAALFFTTEEFKKDAEFMHELYKRGLTHPDILNFPIDTARELKGNGDALLCIQTPLATEQEMERAGVTGKEYRFWLNDDKPFLMNNPLMNSNGIPATTKHPEAGLLFLNWMYAQKENQELVLYGIPGLHWNPVGDDEMETIRNDEMTPLYMFDYWMIEHVKYHRFEAGEAMAGGGISRDEYIFNTRASQTVRSPVIGFNFDPEPVSVELANVSAEYTASILPIKLGVVTYEEGFAKAMDNMRAAGCDALIAEYQKQLTAHIESKK